MHYCAPGEAQQYALAFVAEPAAAAAGGASTPAGVASVEGAELVPLRLPGSSRLAWASSGAWVETPPLGLIFVLRDGVVYAAAKTTQAPRCGF